MSPSFAGARLHARQGSSILASKTDRARAAIRAAVEPLESRVLLSASDILGLASRYDADDPSADLVDAVVASKSHVRQAPTLAAHVAGAAVRISGRGGYRHTAPARPKLPAHADPLSPVGDPAAATATGKSGPGSTGNPVMTTFDNPSGWAVSVWGEDIQDASEAVDAPPGIIRFHAEVTGCGGQSVPSTVTIGYNLGGTAIPGTDYEGELTSGSAIIPICGDSHTGQVDVPFTAKDDDLDEPTETVEIQITGACAAGATSFSFVTPLLANVASGDFTIKTSVGQNDQNGQYQITAASSATVNVGAEVDLIVNLTRFTKPQGGVEVTLTRQDAATNTDAQIVIGSGTVKSLGDTWKLTTDQAGDVKFRIRGVESPGANGGRVTFNISMMNADKRPQGKTFSVLVKP